MSFQMIEIVEEQPGKILATVSHQTNHVTATLPNTAREDIPVGNSFQARIGYDGLVDWKVIDDFEDSESGLWQEEDGVHLRGRVHSIVDFGDGVTMIDVYMQSGPEIFGVSLEAMNHEIPASRDGLEIIVNNLYLYPSDH